MKRTKIKRLVYKHLGTNEIVYGAEEYDANLTDRNILGAIYTLGKHEWCPDGCSLYQINQNNELVYRIWIEVFYQYQKRWWENLADAIRRIVK